MFFVYTARLTVSMGREVVPSGVDVMPGCVGISERKSQIKSFVGYLPVAVVAGLGFQVRGCSLVSSPFAAASGTITSDDAVVVLGASFSVFSFC